MRSVLRIRSAPYTGSWRRLCKAATLERADQMIFQASAGLHPDPLVQAGGNFFEVRVPLRTMGVADARHTKITVGDAQWPKSAIFSLEVQPYR